MPDKNTRVVLDGETGFILPEKNPEVLGRAIADLARDRARGVRLGEKGFEHVRRNFDPDRHAEKVMAIYDRAMLRRAAHLPASAVASSDSDLQTAADN